MTREERLSAAVEETSIALRHLVDALSAFIKDEGGGGWTPTAAHEQRMAALN